MQLVQWLADILTYASLYAFETEKLGLCNSVVRVILAPAHKAFLVRRSHALCVSVPSAGTSTSAKKSKHVCTFSPRFLSHSRHSQSVPFAFVVLGHLSLQLQTCEKWKMLQVWLN